MAEIQASQVMGVFDISPTRSFDETVPECEQWDAELQRMSLPGTLGLMLDDDARVGIISLRQCVHATIGFERLGALMSNSEASPREVLHSDSRHRRQRHL